MKLIGLLIEWLQGCRVRLCAHWFRFWFVLRETPRHKKIDLASGVQFFVPIKGGGRGKIVVGENSKFGFPLAFRFGNGNIMLQARSPEAEIIIGRNNWFSNNSSLCAMKRIQIGDDCRIGDCVAMVDTDFHEILPAFRNRSVGVIKPIIVGNNVWIGSRAMVLKGVTIGDNAVIGAMSLVTADVPANSIAAGVPAKVLGKIEEVAEV